MTRIAVIDIGKTNAKLALVDGARLSEIDVVTRPNRVLPGPPWPHFDLEGHWDFFLHHLVDFHARHGIDAISITTHGASCVLLDRAGQLAAPMLDYEYPGPDALAAEYDALRPDFARTGSPRLPMGLNVGAQLHWMLKTLPGLDERLDRVLTYPQYWGLRLTGQIASDVTSLGCHTDLWDPWQGQFSNLVAKLGLQGRIAPPHRPGEVLGRLLPEIARVTGLPPDTPVTVGIHDSNASLYPYMLGRPAPFAVVSTGTWVVSMAVGGDAVTLDPARDLLVNVNALGQPVPSARFMGGREYEVIRAGSTAAPSEADRRAVLEGGVMLLPAVERESGPFPDHAFRWQGAPQSDGMRMAALSWYLALMTDTCLGLIGARGPTIIEGPFARNPDYCAMLAALRPEGVEVAASATGTSVGAALLVLDRAAPPATTKIHAPHEAARLLDYATRWRSAVE
ncbi:FGGY-family carbohydrate kinase [Paracoccus sp. S1E-3]|uniref:FGGY-family carbohydrate kinase n=1 Tax=Paracoccus sp. S1E-3 TaxID=2756130 RepID=UPI0015EE7FF4|nr:FGGY-family carbohydrate kinase [Paracoccus sp. S1E-3]MBA4490295.1 carbohydrate kinase [Paracoccus sp. S1E-3]